MKKIRLNKKYIYLFILYLIINLICLLYRNGNIQTSFFIDINVVVVANTLLFILSLIATYIHSKATQSKNPNVFIRSVMLMTILKFFILGSAALLYVFLAKQSRNVPAIITGMMLYILYAVIEIRSTYKMNKQ